MHLYVSLLLLACERCGVAATLVGSCRYCAQWCLVAACALDLFIALVAPPPKEGAGEHFVSTHARQNFFPPVALVSVQLLNSWFVSACCPLPFF